VVPKIEALWAGLEQWSPVGFLVTGVGFSVACTLLVIDTLAAVTIHEIVVSIFIVPSLLALFLVALPGFYPYVGDASPRLALAGVATAVGGGLIIAGLTISKIGLDLLGVIGFTEEGPLVFGFILAFIALYLSVLFYGLASSNSGVPSRSVGYLLLLISLEPATVLLTDVVGIDVGVVVALGTLGLSGLAFVVIGYILRNKSLANRRAQRSAESVA
jgi:uncharacterized membrane protein